MNKNNINMKVMLGKEMKITKAERHTDQKKLQEGNFRLSWWKKVFICRTSLTDQELIDCVFTKQTDMVLNFTKLYAIEGDSEFKPEDNVEN